MRRRRTIDEEALPAPEPAVQVAVDQDTIDADAFEETHGESLSDTLDLSSWKDGVDLEDLYVRLDRELGDAVEQEQQVAQTIRSTVFAKLPQQPDAPDVAGVYQATIDDIRATHQGVLFAGNLDTCDGTVVTHDSLVITVTQIGICLVSYLGEQLAIGQRLFRRDLRATSPDPAQQAMDLLERRQKRSAPGVADRSEQFSELARRGIMAYAERAILLERSSAEWRMGHGNVAPYELLTGSGSMDLLEASLTVLERLITEHQKFVFVPSTIKDRLLLSIGDALRPLEYAIVRTAGDDMMRVVGSGHYDGKYGRRASGFVEDVGDDVVVGIYRASTLAGPRPFFAHRDHAHEAALVAMADSALQEHRGFPLSIDIADMTCRSVFGADTFDLAVHAAYSNHGEPFRYLNERDTRS